MDSMELLYQYAWLVPVLPLIGAAVVGTGLISYSQTTSKLRQASAIFIVSLTGMAMVFSFLIFGASGRATPPTPRCSSGPRRVISASKWATP